MDEDVKQAAPIISLNWCALCKRETLPIGPHEMPRRCPSCGHTWQYAERIDNRTENLSI